MATKPKILCSDEVYRLAVWRNAIIVDVTGDIDLEHMQRMGRAYRELAAEYPEGIVSFAMVRESVPVSAAAAREESARFMRELGGVLLRVAMIMEHQGVVAQVIRSVIRGINIVARNPKLVIFRTRDEAIASLGPLIAGNGSVTNAQRELLAAVEAVRHSHQPNTAGVSRVAT